MSQQLHYRLLYYALIVLTISSIVYLMSLFGLLSIYPHFFSNAHPHKWHTLLRMCFVIAFAVVNHLYLVPKFYIQRDYLAFFTIILLCLVSLAILPDLILPKPKLNELKLVGQGRLPFGLRVPLFEIAHVLLFFFMSLFTSMAIRTRQYMEQMEQEQLETIANIKSEVEQEQLAETENIEKKQGETIENKTETALIVTVNYSLIRIEFADIVFIQSMDNYLQFHLKDKKPILVRMTLKEAIEKLPTEDFLRVHKSYIVAISAIKSIRKKTILIAKNEIPIGRTYEESVSKMFVQ